MQKLTCTLVQMDAGSDAARNLWKAETLLRDCPESDVLVLPEVFILRADDREMHAQAETIPGHTIERLAAIARKRHCWIVCGSIIEAEDAKRYNTCAVLNRDGAVAAKYRKIHLFDVQLEGEREIRESRLFAAGSEPAMVNIEGWKCGLSVCYDLRFPELYRHYARYGAHVMFVPSNFTDTTGRAHWEVLLRARAIENQCYVLAPNQCGAHPKLGVKSHGHSLAAGPWGDVLAQAEYAEKNLTVVLDPAALERTRRSVPALEHRRLPS